MGNRSEVIGFSGWKFDNPPRYDPLWFEVINEEYWTEFFQIYWKLPFYAGGIYLATILGVQNYMRDKKALQLKKCLFMWNCVIGLFSILGFVRTAPELYGIVRESNGWNIYRSICVRCGLTKFMFLFPPIGMYVEPIGRWYAVMNYGVHSLMYPYFALKVINVRVPSVVASFITSMQLLQMLTGLFVNFYSVRLINAGVECDRHPNSIRLFALIYGSFTILFGNLFYDLVITRHFRLSKDKKQA
ncbi:unnamed protein product [Orchesella dallaii]|uniref:Elongation of very long chain fatty acids protein n=1 Tax=Orchesella dallaii TaxID=48710 RepID=A0ABP1QBU5_9HEXA